MAEYKDTMIRATAANAQIRAFAVSSRDVVEKARTAHDLSPVATAALGRTMTGALMMADMLKGPTDLLTIQIDGDGPLGDIVVTADNRGGVKGYVQNGNVELPPNAQGHLNVGAAVGKGTLTVIRDLGLKDPYIGRTPLQTGEIAEDLTYYYAASEQVPSSIGLGVLVNRREGGRTRQAGGFIVQLMPFAEEETIAKLEDNLGKIPSVTQMLENGLTPWDMLNKVLDGLDPVLTSAMPVEFRCSCSRDRYSRALVLLGRKEVQEMIDDGEPVEITCRFCGKRYSFSVDELQEILSRIPETAESNVHTDM